MKTLPLITVIVPVYNVEKYLEKCVKSIINQDYKSIEILLVDDGSTDSSGTMCDSYALQDSRIKVIHKRNGGLSDARNVAIDVMKGEFVTYIDSDDYIELDYISYLYKLIVENGADVSVCNFKYVNEVGRIINNPSDTGKVSKYTVKEALSLMLEGKELNTSASMKLYKSKLFEDIRYPKGKLYEDVATTYKTFLKSQIIVYGDRALYIYLCRNGSITKQKFTERRLDAIYNMEMMCKDIMAVYSELSDKCHARLFSQYVSVYGTLKESGNNAQLESELFKKICALRKCGSFERKQWVYAFFVGLGHGIFDILIKIENKIQNFRRKL